MPTGSSNDLFDERPRCTDYINSEFTVTYGISSHYGPRWERAEVKITYEGKYPLEFVSRVDWPPDSDYTRAVRHGILEALREYGELAIGGKFVLESASVHPVDSTEMGFALVAREATASIMRLGGKRPKA